jgi:hypothetical protein
MQLLWHVRAYQVDVQLVLWQQYSQLSKHRQQQHLRLRSCSSDTTEPSKG